MSAVLLSLCDPATMSAALLENLHVAATLTADCSSLGDTERGEETRFQVHIETERQRQKEEWEYQLCTSVVLHKVGLPLTTRAQER